MEHNEWKQEVKENSSETSSAGQNQKFQSKNTGHVNKEISVMNSSRKLKVFQKISDALNDQLLC